MLTVACVWVRSEIFDSVDWVWKLYRMVDRRMGMVHRPFKFVCITPHVEEFRGYDWVVPFPPSMVVPPDDVKKHWWKLNLFALPGDQVLYFDLDVVIMKSIVPLIEFRSDFCVAPSSGVPMRGHDFNSSVMSWKPKSEVVLRINTLITEHFGRKPVYGQFAGDQQWLSSLPIRVDLFPSKWISKYLPKGGIKHPDPDVIVSLLIQGGKNRQLIENGHTWIADYWR